MSERPGQPGLLRCAEKHTAALGRTEIRTYVEPAPVRLFRRIHRQGKGS
jgi:hypothetical protein